MMTALQVSHTDVIGGRFTGFDHAAAYERCGVKLEFSVFDRRSSCSHRLGSGPYSLFRRLPLRKIEHALSIQSLLYPYPVELARSRPFRSADVVHYHLLHTGYFSLLSLPRLTRMKPSLWSWHDPWPLTGHCIHPDECTRWQLGCGLCPDLRRSIRMRQDHTAFMWKLKRNLYASSRFDIVVASRWMQNLVAQSPMADLFSTHLIPFGIDLDVFRPMDRTWARSRLGIAADTFVVCFRSTMQPAKGLTTILAALRRLEPSRRVCLLTFDNVGLLEEFAGRYQLIELGWVAESKAMVEAFSAADLFLMPSTTETFGLMAVEAMACGLPVVVCEGTALPDVVQAPHGGLTIPRSDGAALAGAITRLMENAQECRQMGARARAVALAQYGLDSHVRKMSELYRDVTAKWAAGKAMRL